MPSSRLNVNEIYSKDNPTQHWLKSQTEFPSGHVIQRKHLWSASTNSNHIGTTSTSFVDTGIYGDFTPIKSSSESQIKLEMSIGRFEHYGVAAYATVTMTTVANDTTTHSDSNDIFHASTYYRWFGYDTSNTGHYQNFEAYIASWSPGVNTYNAGTAYRFRIYLRASSGNAILVHNYCQAQFHALEIMI
tara:strand:- start:1096 stop:1662 length:567 start_codon:yes stop_codon:yes gene_type:complete